jgi:hypothetical protein
MQKYIPLIPEAGIFLAGVLVAGFFAIRARDKAAGGAKAHAAEMLELRRVLAAVESRLSCHESATSARLTDLQSRIEEHSARLAETPSPRQIMAAMDQLHSNAMASLDDRLSMQANSIEVIKAAVSQTDGLLERVLESLDALQSYSDSVELTGDTVVHSESI